MKKNKDVIDDVLFNLPLNTIGDLKIKEISSLKPETTKLLKKAIKQQVKELAFHFTEDGWAINMEYIADHILNDIICDEFRYKIMSSIVNEIKALTGLPLTCYLDNKYYQATVKVPDLVCFDPLVNNFIVVTYSQALKDKPLKLTFIGYL
jgi:hypothetical protein